MRHNWVLGWIESGRTWPKDHSRGTVESRSIAGFGLTRAGKNEIFIWGRRAVCYHATDMKAIFGQKHAIKVLQAGLASGRSHHAFIFYGPKGVGKFTTAAAFARVILCHAAEKNREGVPTACGRCPSCTLLDAPPPKPAKGDDGEDLPAAATAHPDLHIVNKELARYSSDRLIRERKLLTIPYEVLRDHLVEPVYHTSQLRHNKVFIVDEAELITPVGQNVLLKALEEPPAGTYIILVTSNEDRLLPTIRSRCQRVGFGPLTDGDVAAWVDGQKGAATGQRRDWAIAFAQGSLGRAGWALDYDLHQWAQAVVPALDAMVGGECPLELGKTMAKFIDDFAADWVKSHAGASKEAANKQAAALMWSMITQHACQRIGEIARRTDGEDESQQEAVLAPWLRVIDAVGRAEAELAANINLTMVCDHLAITAHDCLSPA